MPKKDTSGIQAYLEAVDQHLRQQERRRFLWRYGKYLNAAALILTTLTVLVGLATIYIIIMHLMY